MLRDARLACTDEAKTWWRRRVGDWRARVLAATGITIPAANPDEPPDLGLLEEALRVLQSGVGTQMGRAIDRVFVVHGRADGVRETVARLLETLGLTAVILDEQPMRGRALLEKFEQEADEVGYAVVIALPEDRGAGPGEPHPAEPNRARQNVILEVGYFMGLLGRDRVTVLYQQPLELPSDLDGFGYIPMEGDWRYRLTSELMAAGMQVDTARLLSR